MAILHQATLTPSKIELLDRYLATVPGLLPFVGEGLAQVGSYRFDDPAGDVGIETHILTSTTGALLHMPLTYRSAPVEGWEPWLAGQMDHSVLGPRWAYNACIRSGVCQRAGAGHRRRRPRGRPICRNR